MAQSDIDPRFLVDLNQQRYYFKITLYNGVDSPVELDYFMVDQLTIEETLHNWNTIATLVLRNEYEILERGSPENNQKPIYIFRHDARNKVNVRIFPVFNPETRIIVSENPAMWEINYDFVVYEIEDVPSNDLSKKKKKLYMWDERYQHFLERNIQWSTYYVAEERARQINESNPELARQILLDRTCRVGDAIKHLIQTACGENNLNSFDQKPLTVGWDPDRQYSSIDKPDLGVARFSETWDRGAEANELFYTSPATTNVLEDLFYLLKYFVSESSLKDNKLGLSGILQLNRYTKLWSLQSLDSFYKKSTSADGKSYGDDVIERLFIQTAENQTKGVGGNSPIPVFVSGEIINGRQINAGMSSIIFSYKFFHMSATDDLKLINKPVVNYKNNKSKWYIYGQDNSIESAKNILQKDIVSKLYSKNNSSALLNINKDKKNGLTTRLENIVVQSNSINVQTRNETVQDSIFLNQAIEFDSLGLTLRTPGKFISVEKNNLTENNAFEDRFIGQWLITRTTHNFYQDKYITNVVAVKVNSYSKINAFDSEKDKFKE